jgi:hypothetical protein
MRHLQMMCTRSTPTWTSTVKHFVTVSKFKHQSGSFFLFVVLAFELRAYTLSQNTSPFLWKVLWDRVWRTICLGWLWNVILLTSASWVARITGVSHQHLLNSEPHACQAWGLPLESHLQPLWILMMSLLSLANFGSPLSRTQWGK